MAGILDFDAERLGTLVRAMGVRNAWLSIFATHVRSLGSFNDILASPEYASAQFLDSNLLEGLSVGEISVLYEYSVALENPDARKDNGQFFTPDDVAIFMASFAKEFSEGVWLDPCSGVGNLSWHLASTQVDPEDFVLNRLKVSDRDELALLLARTLLAISFQRENSSLFSAISANFFHLDFLSVADNGQSTLLDDDNQLNEIPKHDFVIVNPPYLGLKKKDLRFETSDAADLYAYFLENIIKTSSGFISVTPQSFTNASKFRSLRRLLLDKYSNLTIFTFDNIPGNLFKGIKFGSTNSNTANSIRAAVIVARPGAGTPQITSLFRWRTAERLRTFAEVDKFLCAAPLTDAFFPKVSAPFLDLYEKCSNLEVLGHYLCRTPTDYPLYVPSAPRYFISALRVPVERTSIRTLYFNNAETRDRAYLLLNSSFMYWWWRVRDGGMTLSLETLSSLPFLNFAVSQALVEMLVKSEKENKVFKMNAGSSQENVKHDLDLVSRLNQLVIPEFAPKLLKTHENSEFVQID